MIWAIVNNIKTEASPKTAGIYPLCKRKVISKCGEIKAWHWAHSSAENCDTWSENETFWHLHWKNTFGIENSEVIIEKNEKLHIADILTYSNVVIELQNSPLLKGVIRKREEFYGERMMWLINGQVFLNNFSFYSWASNSEYWIKNYPEYSDRIEFEWKYPRKCWEESNRTIFIDFGDDKLFQVQEGMGTSTGNGRWIPKERFIKKYGGNFDFYSGK